MVWGTGGLKSCDSLLSRVENNDPILKELIILPMKNFGGTEVERLASSLESKKNTNLTTLAASGHSVPPFALGKLGTAIASGKSNLTRLSIGDQTMGDEGVMALCAPMECVNGGNIEVLDLAWKNISKVGMEALGRTFGRSTHIRQLNLSRNEKIGDEGINAFLESIGDTEGNSIMESLEMLDLGASEIGSKGIEALAKLIIRCPRRSLSLTLTSNPLKAASCLSLSSIVCGLSRIKSLYLARCDIGDAGVEYLTASMRMKKCTGLDTLDLSYNGIGPKGAKNLASVFWIDGEGHFESLAELVLAGNLLGQDGVMHLGRSLAHKNGEGGLVPGNTTLEILDLTQTNCGNDGAVAIMRCSMLRRVRLFNNKLGDNGFDSLASELNGGHPTLEQLDIGGNNATKDAVIRVLDAVGTINTLIDSKLDTLEIGGNETDFDVEEAIKRVKSVRPELDIARDKPRPKQEEGDDSPPIQ